MVDGPEEAVAFRLWPPVAIGAPLLVGWLATLLWGDPVDLGGWRVPLGWVLVLLFAGWNGWSLWLFGRRGTGLLPGQANYKSGTAYRLSRRGGTDSPPSEYPHLPHPAREARQCRAERLVPMPPLRDLSAVLLQVDGEQEGAVVGAGPADLGVGVVGDGGGPGSVEVDVAVVDQCGDGVTGKEVPADWRPTRRQQRQADKINADWVRRHRAADEASADTAM